MFIFPVSRFSSTVSMATTVQASLPLDPGIIRIDMDTPTQARTVRAQTTAWPPPSSGHTRPWRSSPLAGPAFSTLPPVIPESSEENELGQPAFPRTRSPSIASQTGSLSASGYGSRNASGSASALALADGEASTSSVSLGASTAAHGTSSASSQSHASRPARLSKPFGRRPSSAQGPSKNTSDVFITRPPRARTVSHGHSRPASFPVHPLVPSPTIPQAYSRSSPRPTSPDSDANTAKQPPSKSRDPSSNWMSSSPFGPAQTPKFSRLAMASPAVVMPLSAKEYRKQKAKEKDKDKDPPSSSNRVGFVDAISNGVPLVKVSPPTSEDLHRAPFSSGDHSSDRRSQPQSPKPLPQPSMSPRPSSPKQKRPRSRPNTPPRSSPLAAHPPISPKSSTGTFFSFASVSDDDTSPSKGADTPPSTSFPADDPNALPPARPRLRPRRRKSYPDRLSNGARLSLLEAMNRLSQESTALHRLSGLSQSEGANRLSVASQASGHTLFYDVVESEGEQGQVTTGNGNGNGNGNENGHADRDPRTSVLHTQSLEDLSSTLARTGIEGVGEGQLDDPVDEERKGKRNVRVVRISDKVEVSPPPMPRRRKLTKSRPGLARGLMVPVFGTGPAPVTGRGPVKEVKVQTQTQTHIQERRVSLLPWKSKGSGDSTVSVVSSGVSTPTKGLVYPDETIPRHPLSLIPGGSTHIENHSQSKSNLKKPSPDTPAPSPTPDPKSATSTPPRKSRRYTFSLLPSSTFQRPKREKTHTAPPSVDLGLDQHADRKLKATESGTDSTSTSIRTITQGSQSTLVPASPVLCDPTTPASSGILSGSGSGRDRDGRSSVPMLRRLTAQEMEMAVASIPSQSDWGGKTDSTPSLITNGSTGTSSSSAPRTPSFGRASGGGEFIPRPSALKESFTDTSEEDSEGVPGGTARGCVHRRPDKSPLARGAGGWGETLISDDNERYLRPNAGVHPGPRPGSASSTLTTATETSGSYASFSTVPASSASSSASTSRSESPSPTPVGDKQYQVRVQDGDGDGDGDGDACVLCGHRSTSPLPGSPLSTRESDVGEIHPMFMVPLVTVPGTSPRSAPSGRAGGVPRYARKSQRQSVPVPVVVSVGVPPSRHDLHSNPNHMPVKANGGPTTSTSTMPRIMPMPDKTTRTSPSPSPLPPPPKVKLRRRPQTAPAGTGDAATKFIEDTKAMRVREGSIDAHTHLHPIGMNHPTTKHKPGESRFKAVLKGLLKWGA